jgi:cytochrome c peroxidase
VKKWFYVLMAVALVSAVLVLMGNPPASAEAPAPRAGDIVTLGKLIFLDENLSKTGTQSCASCHGEDVGFTGPDSATNAGGAVYQGAIPGRYGNRKPPASAYAGESPVLHQDATGAWFGGMFWDGRATGSVLGDPLAEQAQGPFLNPLEQALPSATTLCRKVKTAAYASLFKQVWGAGSLNCATDANGVYERIGRSVAAYERSPEVNPFTSKFDLFWDTATAAGKDVTLIKCGMGGGGGGGGMGCPGGGSDPNRWTAYRNLGLTDAELQGLAVFNDPNKANCASCHTLAAGNDGYPLFTDFGYDNLGVPKNLANPFYHMPPRWNPDGENWVDYGLGHYLESAGYPLEVYQPQMGKVKVPTLRNVDLRPSPDLVKAYGHNGFFKSLTEVVQFYQWRAMMDHCMGGCGGMQDMFPPPEVDQNRAILNMFPMPQIGNIVAFLQTLSDGYFVR